MLDIKLVRQHPEAIKAKIKTKEPSSESVIDAILALDRQAREIKTQVEQLKSARNELSDQIGILKRRGEDASALLEKVSHFGNQIHDLDHALAPLEQELLQLLSTVPNLPMDDIPISDTPKDNVMIKEFKQKPIFDFPFKNHVELNERLNLFDFKRGAKISGTGWPVYKGLGARLEWALLNYMIDIHIKNGFEQWIPPILVRKDILFGSGQLPKFENQQFKIKDPDYHLYLIPTAEVPLNGLHYDEILDIDQLPLKYIAYTPCFRREAGAAGSQERGLIRMHQFNKVEMFCFSKPEESMQLFDQMMASAEEILQGLELHYRNMLLVTGDMSFASARTVDIEVWLPGQDRYYEVSSVSNCTDYQSRRSQIRYRKKGEKPEFVHTLNGSGLATSRLMVALLENNQQADGSVLIPSVLQKYLGGVSRLMPTV
ncbi:serine--tRNA ligase [Parachlamydia sp. AcF125]|uniref:serine--tRNA ligase n=1 Tax=Parachlamydia sp. AcF125 TaxID=2795736 RepID=UPI001BC94AE8|nr:serine--tRNA ligase [Parachlamydia sp. AcF125]MBS4167401.1 Serine--tRNA ligase [Parachlamydia sp. AcF125]